MQAPVLKILIVEDAPTYSAWVSALIRQEARHQGREVDIAVATSLVQALSSLSSSRVDAVLLDLNLPDSEGLLTVTALTERFPTVPVVVISADGNEATALRALGEGAEEYVFKGREKEGGVFRTITRSIERKVVQVRLENALRSARENERMAAVGMLASGVAHEYNNVGAVILGNTELLLKSNSLAPEDQSALQDIHDAARRGNAVTQGLLRFVRGFREPMGLVGMHAVVLDTVHMAEATIRSFNVNVCVTAAGPPLYVQGNASILGQVLLNLIINACHAMLGREPRDLRLTLSQTQDQRFVLLEVSDTGHGIAIDDLPKVFLPFFSTKGEHSRGDPRSATLSGTGLGLTICESFVKQHQGRITVQSTLGVGSAFTVALPTADPEADVPHPQDATCQQDSARLAGVDVLVVDDDPAIRRIVTLSLSALGAKVEAVSSVKAAVAYLQGQQPQLVLVDWQMPNDNGWVLVNHVLAKPASRQPALLVISGNLSSEDESSLDQQGVPRLPKPFDLDSLGSAARAALRGRPLPLTSKR